MRILIILLFSVMTVFGQYGGNKTGGYSGSGFGGGTTGQRFSAVDLDSSTEYKYRNYAVADSFLNLNGYERIQNANSTGFESTVGTWLNKGNHAIDTVTANKIYGNKSGQIISSGAGDSLANFVCIVPSVTSYHGVTAGNKYTLELWHKALFVSPGDSLIVYHGGKRKAFLASTTAGKAVYNYEANSFTAARDTIKIYTNNASGDTILIDSVNFSQAHDAVYSFWTYPRSNATKWIFSRGGGGTGRAGTSLYYTSASSAITADIIGVGQTSITVSSNAIPVFQWAFITLTYDRTGFCSLYVNGVYRNRVDMSGVGNMVPITGFNQFTLGKYNVAGDWYDGLMGEFRITRFDNIASSTWTTATPLTTYNAYTRGNGFTDNITGGGKKIAVWYDWMDGTSDALFLMDLSGNGYNLTGSNVTTADRVNWKR